MQNALLKSILFIPITVFLLYFTCSEQKEPDHLKITGVKMYSLNDSLPAIFNSLESMGINTIFCPPKLNARFDFRKMCRKYKLKRFVIFPVFYNPAALKKDSTLWSITDNGQKAKHAWMKFICPSRKKYRTASIDTLKDIVKEYDPDGISLDFIRYFVFWENFTPEVDPDSIPNTCFCNYCLRKFQSDLNLKTPFNFRNKKEVSRWIKENHRHKWIKWKCNIITSMVVSMAKEIKKIDKDIVINLHAIPWKVSEYDSALSRVAGQDLNSMVQYVDYISPMTYSHMLSRNHGWIGQIIKNHKKITDGKILPNVQVSAAYRDKKLTAEHFRNCIFTIKNSNPAGIIFWHWKALSADLSKQQIIKNLINN